MRWKCLGIIAALVGMSAIPVFAWAAHATTGLAIESSTTLAPGVTYTAYYGSGNAIDVTRIAAGASVVIKAVPASPDGGGATASVTALCQQVNAVACINGDFFGPGGVPLGGELVDGRWLRAPTSIQQQLWLDAANRFSIGAQPAGAVQSLGATSYAILLPGQPISIPEQDAFSDGAHARTLVGWNGTGDRFFVTVEGGMSLAQAADLMRTLGATTAVNEDGGGSTQMVVDGVRHGGSRWVANIWAVVAVAPPPASLPPSLPPPPGSSLVPQAPDLQARSQQWVVVPHH